MKEEGQAEAADDGTPFDDELCVVNHVCEYLNEADDRAKERLMFYLVHRYFPTGSFSPKGSP